MASRQTVGIEELTDTDPRKLAPVIATMFAVAYFFTLSCLWPTRPGLYMDESNFVNAALGGRFPHQMFVAARILGIPVLILPYYGALKSALFAPVFALFGVSPLSIRVPAIIISATSLIVAYQLARGLVGRWGAAILVMLMASCPAFVMMSKVDWGPTVLPMLLKLAAFLAFFKLLQTKRVRWLWVLLAIFVLGFYNKEDFQWVIVAVTIAAGVCYWRPLVDIIHSRPRATTAAIATFVCVGLVGFLWLVLMHLEPSHGSLQNPIWHLRAAWRLYENTVDSSEVIGFFTGNAVVQPAWMSWLWVPTLACLGIVGLLRLHGPLPPSAAEPARAAAFFLVVGFVILVEIAATKQAVGPQHAIALWPIPDLVLVFSAVAVLRAGTQQWVVVIAVVAGVALVGTFIAQGIATQQYVALMEHPSELRPVLSTDVYRDAAFLRSNAQNVDQIISAGWGPGVPLFSLACPSERRKYQDVLWERLARLTPQNAVHEVRLLFDNERVLLVSISNPARDAIPLSLRSNVTLIDSAYRDAFPGRRPRLVLATSAYDITYLGPGTFNPGHGEGC